MLCIYCEKDKPIDVFTSVDHVLSQSFGRFQNNLTLKQMVCDDCNKYFGDHLEIFLGRDTPEGLFRYDYGIKNPNEFKSLGSRSRLIIRIAEGRNKGAYVYPEYSKETGRLIVKPLPQVGFLRMGSSDYTYYLLDDLPDRASLERAGFDLKHPRGIFVFANHLDEVEPALRMKGITLVPGDWEEIPVDSKEEWLCEIERDIDDTLCRAVAKISLNYLAHWEGKDFVTSKHFDPIRKYVRYAKQSEFPLVIAQRKGVLADESRESVRRLGHLITVNWAADGRSIVAQVSLFNTLKYSVSLARDYSGERKEIRRGHFFNIKDKTILELKTK